MNLGPDYFIERRIQKRQMIIWKILVILLCCFSITILFFNFRNLKINSLLSKKFSKHIALVNIDGIILDDNKRDKKLASLENDPNVVAVILNINSPGGSAAASEKLYNVLHKIQVKKPLVALMGTVAASGGYLISLSADYIISHYTTLTGSIGVIFQSAEVTELAKKLGIKFNNFKSGELKGMLSPTEQITPVVKNAINDAIQDTYDYFVDLLVIRRKIPKNEVFKIADGRVYTGRQAYGLKLVDKLGTIDDALIWLHERGVSKDLEIVEVSLKDKPSITEMFLNGSLFLFKDKITKVFSNFIFF